MNKCDAIYNRVFAGGSGLITAVEFVATLVDDDWRHSWHWPNPKTDWHGYIDAVNRSIESELGAALKRIRELETAKRIIEEMVLDE